MTEEKHRFVGKLLNICLVASFLGLIGDLASLPWVESFALASLLWAASSAFSALLLLD